MTFPLGELRSTIALHGFGSLASQVCGMVAVFGRGHLVPAPESMVRYFKHFRDRALALSIGRSLRPSLRQTPPLTGLRRPLCTTEHLREAGDGSGRPTTTVDMCAAETDDFAPQDGISMGRDSSRGQPAGKACWRLQLQAAISRHLLDIPRQGCDSAEASNSRFITQSSLFVRDVCGLLTDRACVDVSPFRATISWFQLTTVITACRQPPGSTVVVDGHQRRPLRCDGRRRSLVTVRASAGTYAADLSIAVHVSRVARPATSLTASTTVLMRVTTACVQVAFGLLRLNRLHLLSTAVELLAF